MTASRDRELDYYRRRLDEVAGETLRQDYELSGLRKEVNQKRNAFRLLSRLQQTIGSEEAVSDIWELVLQDVNGTLGMDRTVVLVPTERAGYYRPSQWTGFAEEGRGEEFDRRMTNLTLQLPDELVEGRASLLVNKESERTPLIDAIQDAFELPFFVGTPVVVESIPIAVLLSGRVKEAGSVYPPLNRADVETFQAIAGLVCRSLENRRIGVLKEMDRLKTQFFANLSHEFRTPITLTLGPLEQILAGRFGDIPDKVREQVELMQRSQERLLGLINQLLNLARLEAGRLPLRATPLRNVNGFIERSLAAFRGAAETRGLTFSTSFDPRLFERSDVVVDRERLDELVANLLSNAVKFTAEGSIAVATELHEKAFQLRVTDTGIGIRADQIPLIFDRFRQADGSASRAFPGTGLGLAWVKEIVDMHGGTISVRSVSPRGTTFIVDLPLGTAHFDPSSVVEFDEKELPSLGGRHRAYFLSEATAVGRDTDDLNRVTRETFDPLRPTILYVEDNADLRRYMRGLLADQYNVFLAVDGRDGLEKARQQSPDLMIIDQMMPHMSGTQVLAGLREQPELRAIPVIFLTARVRVEDRIEALDAGAADYLTKPFDAVELFARVRNLLRIRAQERKLRELNEDLVARIEDQMAAMVRRKEVARFLPKALVENVVSRNPRMQELMDLTWKIADAPSTVLIKGETGTGKEVFAQAIHMRGPRRDGPFVPVNCAGVPTTLFESELFGHERGAFTGAVTTRKGRFELAHGGTLFLDEVGDIPLEAQTKLLRVLQERCIERVGGTRTIPVDVRVVAATNRDLDALMAQGSFREDLYYRLNVLPLNLPPLRERPEDIPPLAAHFLNRDRQRPGQPPLVFSPEAMEQLCSYSWPGNIRELRNVVERMAVLVEGNTIWPHHLPPEIRVGAPAPHGGAAHAGGFATLEEQERHHVREALRITNGVIRGEGGAAALLGVPESTLRYRIKKLGLNKGRRA